MAQPTASEPAGPEDGEIVDVEVESGARVAHGRRRASMTEHAVVVAGGGPTGLMLAGELALAGVDVEVIEPRATRDLGDARAGGLHARTLEVLDQRGVVERFVAAGRMHPQVAYAGIALDIGDFPTRHPGVLALWQRDFERILAGWVLDELGVPIRRERAVTGFTQDADGVTVALSDGTSRRSQYLVGCDGGRSIVRTTAGVEFAGLEPATSWMIAEVDLDDPEIGARRGGGGIGPVDRAGGGGPYRVVVRERRVMAREAPDLDDLRAALVDVYGTDFAASHATYVSRFTDGTRLAGSYRVGRVLLAGDAAHVHPPQGGQGLNVGVQDAVNLGWKLAHVARGTAPDSLLDSYQAERHPVGARLVRSTEAMVALGTPDDRHDALRDTMRELLTDDGPRRRIVGMLSGLDVRYDLGDAHPLVGRRMPDLDLRMPTGTARVSTLLHDAPSVLVDLDARGGLDLAPWADRVRVITARVEGEWELPVIGRVAAPPAVLIRPDGHVAWAGDLADPELVRAGSTWCGVPDPG